MILQDLNAKGIFVGGGFWVGLVFWGFFSWFSFGLTFSEGNVVGWLCSGVFLVGWLVVFHWGLFFCFGGVSFWFFLLCLFFFFFFVVWGFLFYFCYLTETAEKEKLS